MSSSIIEHTELEKLIDAPMKTNKMGYILKLPRSPYIEQTIKMNTWGWEWSSTDIIKNDFWPLQT